MTNMLDAAILSAVDVVVPEGLSFTIPDIKSLLPTDAWLVGCTAALALSTDSQAKNAVMAFNALKLPYVITSDTIKSQVRVE